MSITRQLPRFVLAAAQVPGLLVAGVVPAVARPGQQSDEAAIRALLATQAEAWNRGDAAAWCEVFEPDAEFVNVFGMVFSGRKEIEERHAVVFATFLKGTRTTVTLRRLVFLTPRLAIVDSDHVVTDYGALPLTLHPLDGAVRTRMKYVLRKNGGRWSVVAAQNTEMKPP